MVVVVVVIFIFIIIIIIIIILTDDEKNLSRLCDYIKTIIEKGVYPSKKSKTNKKSKKN